IVGRVGGEVGEGVDGLGSGLGGLDLGVEFEELEERIDLLVVEPAAQFGGVDLVEVAGVGGAVAEEIGGERGIRDQAPGIGGRRGRNGRALTPALSQRERGAERAPSWLW
ncbi:MAG: hypothetical protein AAFQ71_09840, partial [Planctomycetota bacterium]